MIAHIESDACPIFGPQHLKRYAMKTCKLTEPFMDLSQTGEETEYFCPGCWKSFDRLGSLFQHVESEACGESLDAPGSSLAEYLEVLWRAAR